MNTVTIIWTAAASASLTLAGIYLFIWFRRPDSWGSLFFSMAAVGAAGSAACELSMMLSQTPEEIGTGLRWMHVPAAVITLAILGFVRVYLRAGRPWLLWMSIGLRLAALALNFLMPPNLNFREITGLQHLVLLGEVVAVPEGVPNPWMLVGQASIVLMLAFIVDATIATWRRGDRRLAITLGGSLSIFSFLAILQSALVFWGWIHVPVIPSVYFLGMVLAMGYELGRDVLFTAQLSQELRGSEERMALAAAAANLGFWSRDIVHDQIWATDRWRDLFGFSKTQPLQFDSFLQRIHPEDRDNIRRILAAALASSGGYETEYRVRLPDGRIRWIISRGGVARSDAGKPVAMHGVSADITKRKQAEEKFRLVVEASPSGIVLLNREGRILLVNAETEKLFGYARDELIGSPVEMLVPQGSRAGHQGHRASFFEVPHARAMGVGRELFAVRKDGSQFPVEIGLSPIQSDEETLVLTAIVDISARNQMEADARLQRAELAHLSRVNMLGELSGSLAHELNQPLTAILSNAQAALRFLARKPHDLSEIGTILQDIVEDNKRAGEIIRRLRGLLRKDEAQHQVFDMNDVALDVVRLMRSDLLHRNVAVTVELAEHLPKVHGDRIQLQQVLVNLLMNGCDAMEDLPNDRRLTLRTELNSQGHVAVAVVDRGMGIPAADIERIFDPFVTTKAEGMGLGLAVCRTIIGAHGGKLWATNNPVQGASLHFTLKASS